MKLDNLSEIRTGLVLSRKKADKLSANVVTYKILTLKSFNNDGYILSDELDDFKTNQYINKEYITQEGDVVIRLSVPNTAAYIDQTLEGLIIPSLFAIIRVKSNKLDKKYLAWFLNSTYIKREMMKSRIGSAIQIINTKFLEEIEIKLIPLESQKIISKMINLYLKEKKLLGDLINEKEKLYKSAINKIYGEEI